jgi:hypothetical protein
MFSYYLDRYYNPFTYDVLPAMLMLLLDECTHPTMTARTSQVLVRKVIFIMCVHVCHTPGQEYMCERKRKYDEIPGETLLPTLHEWL